MFYFCADIQKVNLHCKSVAKNTLIAYNITQKEVIFLIGDRIRELRIKKGLNMKQVSNELGIAYTTYVSYEKNYREPNSEVLIELSDYFNCTIDYLIGKDELKEKAIKKFGFCWDYIEREEKKAESRNLISNGNLTNEEIYENAIIIFKALFSRSLEGSCYNLNHVDFNAYVSMLLNQEQWKKEYNLQVYEMLKKQFGVSNGIPQGTYYDCYKSVHQFRKTKTVHFKSREVKSSSLPKPNSSLNLKEKEIIKKYRKLNKHGKEIVETVIDIEYKYCEDKEIHTTPSVRAARSFGDKSKIDRNADIDEQRFIDAPESDIDM